MANQDREGSESDFRSFPVNITRSEVDADNLHLYSQELDQKSATLFVQTSADCKVELWQATRLEGRGGKSPTHVIRQV